VFNLVELPGNVSALQSILVGMPSCWQLSNISNDTFIILDRISLLLPVNFTCHETRDPKTSF
jgi:hypothetical protein